MAVSSYEDLEQLDLESQISNSFKVAIENDEIEFSKVKEVEVIEEESLTVELKVLESLEQKEKAPKEKNFNPFAEPEKGLIVVEDFYNDFRILLNKFPVSENHFLLTTKAFKNQDDLLNARELIATYDILKTLNSRKNSNYFAFYNSGPESGFSQRHRHVQFVKYPLKNLKLFPEYTIKGKPFFLPKEGDESRQPFSDEAMHFKHYILPLPKSFENVTEKEDVLSILYIELFKKLLNFFKALSKHQLETEGEVLENNLNIKSIPISYNLIMNQNFMMVIPRKTSHYPSQHVSINAVAFVGLLLAKNEEQKKVILKDGIDSILKECGFSKELSFGQGEDEYDY